MTVPGERGSLGLGDETMWRRFFLGLPAVLACIQLSGAACADSFYASPAAQDANFADVGIDGGGNAIFTWTSFTPQGIIVQLRSRSAAGTLGATKTLSKTGHDAQSAHVAVNGAGAAVAVWQIHHGDASAKTPVQGRARAADGTFGTIFNVDPHPGGSFSFDFANPNVAMDDVGNAVFTWIGLDSAQKRRAYARTRAADGTFGRAFQLSPPGVSEVRMAVNGGGDAVFVWVWNDGAGHNLIQARRLSADGTRGRTKIIGQGVPGSGGGGLATGNPQVALNSDGDALIVWEQPDGAGACGINGCPKILARTLSKAGKVGTVPQTLTTTVDGGRSPQVAMDSRGRAVVTWRHSGLEFRTRGAGGVLGPLQQFTTATDADVPVLKGDPAGNTVAVWSSASVVQARTRSQAGVLGPIDTFSIDGQSSFGGVAAIGTNGDAIVAWGQLDGLGQCSGGTSCNRIGAAADP